MIVIINKGNATMELRQMDVEDGEPPRNGLAMGRTQFTMDPKKEEWICKS